MCVCKFCGAVGAELVVIGDFALAGWAGRMQIIFAIRAEVKARIHSGATLRASVRKRLTHQQINDQTN